MNIATPFIVALASTIQVYVSWVICSKYIVVKESDICCSITDYNSNREHCLRNKDLLLYNTNIDCNNSQGGEQLYGEIDPEKDDQPWNAYFIKRGDTCIQILQNSNK